jgi:uncharacterized membrane protein YsdA (DUF1294 family)
MSSDLSLLASLIGVNLLTFGLYWVDKRAAERQQWRIPEHTLLTLIFLGGTPAAIVASRHFRHKTKKSSFRMKFYLTVMAQIAVVGWWLVK